MTEPRATTRRMLGIDFGARRIGVAVSEGRVAVPRGIIEHTTRAADIERIAQIARDERAEGIVLGLPLLPSGDEGAQARRTRSFGAALGAGISLPLHYHDELLSTSDATSPHATARLRPTPLRRRRGGKVRVRVDDVAAALILQRWLDARGG